MNVIQANGIDIYYEQTGCGAPLILLHGNSESSKIFKEQIGFFKDSYTVYALDSRGQGKTNRDEGALSYELFAFDVIAFMDALKIDKADIIGFSDGAIIGIILGFTYPERVGKLVLAGPNVTPDGNKSSSVKLIKFGRAVFKLIGNKNSVELMNLMLIEPHISTEQLNSIKAPSLVIGGDKDMIKNEHLIYIANSIPKAEIKIFTKTNHFTYKHKDFNETVKVFLNGKL